MTGLPSAGFMRFLDRVEPMVAGGESVESIVRGALSHSERVPGVGRPVLRGDERVGPMLEAMRRHGRAAGVGMTLALGIDHELARQKRLRVNSAGFCGAVMRDLGFAPAAAAAFCLTFFIVPMLTHAVGRDGQAS